MIFQIVLLALGLALVAFPSLIHGDSKRRHDKRLEELRAGANEAFFEEKRALEAYPPRGSWQTRLLGGFLILIALSELLLGERM